MNSFIIWLVIIVTAIITYYFKKKSQSKEKNLKYRRLLIATILGSLVLFAVNYQSTNDLKKELLKEIPTGDVDMINFGGVSDILINLDEF